MKNKKRSKGANENTKAKNPSGKKVIRKSKVEIPAEYSTHEEKVAYLVEKIQEPSKYQNETPVEKGIRIGRFLRKLSELLNDSSSGAKRVTVKSLAACCEISVGTTQMYLTLARRVDPRRHPVLLKVPLRDVITLIGAAKGRKLGPFLREKGLDPKFGAETPQALAEFKIRLKEINRDRSKRPIEPRFPADPIRHLGAHLKIALEHLNGSLHLLTSGRVSLKQWMSVPMEEVREILKTHRVITLKKHRIDQKFMRIKRRFGS